MSDPVREFLARTITSAGGVVEDSPGGLEALLPASVAQRLGVAEVVRIQLSSSGAQAGEAADGVVDGRIGSSLLERIIAARLEQPVLASVAFPPGFPAHVSDKLPVLLNAVRAGAPERWRTACRFLTAEVRATLHGEELRSAQLSLTIRLDDGARTEPFRVGGAYPVVAAPLGDDERRITATALRSWLWREGPALLGVALDALRQRGCRDLERMAEYYASLDREMAKAADRARSADERTRRQAKWAALPADLDSRRDQLRTRLRPRLAARIVAATLVETDVEQFVIPVRRRKREGSVTLTCRMADGVFEGPACASCGVATVRLYLCDERLHVLCQSCGQQGALDAARCRACRGSPPERVVVRLVDPTAGLHVGPPRQG